MDYLASSAALRRGDSPQHIMSTPGYHQHSYEDLYGLEKSTGQVVGEDFSIDDLLNFSSMPDEALEQPPSKEEYGEEKVEEDDHAHNSNSSSALSFDVVHEDQPLLPAGDISDLEWVSQIVDDSFVVDLPCSAMPPAYFHHLTTTATKNHSRSPSSASVTSASTSTKRTFTFSDNTVEVPSKARSKRARTGRVRSFHHLQLPEPMICSPVSSSSSCSSTSSPSSCLLFEPKPLNPDVFAGPVLPHRGRGRPPLHKKKSDATATATTIYQKALPTKQHKKKGRKPKAMRPTPAEHHDTSTTTEGVTGRRCSHCGVQKTPQWRAGPLGAKTLCNACGVRYKSGRLLPEYRPAISPTFLDDVHSNSHRKVLEMRRKKELLAQHHHQHLLDIGDSAAAGSR